MATELKHHSKSVLSLCFSGRTLVTSSADRSIAVWDMASQTEITVKHVLVGHRAAVNVVKFDEEHIVSGSGDRSIKVWSLRTYELVHDLKGHTRGVACLQFRNDLIVSGSSDNTVRLWDIKSGTCIRMLEGHRSLVRCVRFDSRIIVSGDYDGWIKVWNLKVALDTSSSHDTLYVCLCTLRKHTGKVLHLQFDSSHMVSGSSDNTILIWDFSTAP